MCREGAKDDSCGERCRRSEAGPKNLTSEEVAYIFLHERYKMHGKGGEKL